MPADEGCYSLRLFSLSSQDHEVKDPDLDEALYGDKKSSKEPLGRVKSRELLRAVGVWRRWGRVAAAFPHQFSIDSNNRGGLQWQDTKKRIPQADV